MTDKEFLEELNKLPDLKNRFMKVLSIATNSGKEFVTLADDAEMAVITQMRHLGKETLQNWANNEMLRVSKNTHKQIKDAKKHVKKNSGGTPPMAKYGSQAKYLIDFYHASEYLAAAAHECAADNHKKWLHTQQQLLKVGRYKIVLNNLKNYALTHEGSATHKCYSYLMRRLHQLHYDEAIKYDLPIGSGEIESAHRYIIQNRVKIQGAWWLLGNAESMISLSICRANNDWKCYWENCDAA